MSEGEVVNQTKGDGGKKTILVHALSNPHLPQPHWSMSLTWYVCL